MSHFEQLISQVTIELGFGVAQYKMKRGSFKTKDRVNGIKTFKFVEKVAQGFKFNCKDQSLIVEYTPGAVHTLRIVNDDSLSYNRMWIHFPSSKDECFFGCGEQFTRLNLKGEKVKNWVSEHHALSKLIKKTVREHLLGVNPSYVSNYKQHQTYYAQPTFVSSNLYFVHCDTRAYSEFDFTKPNRTTLYFREIPTAIHYCKKPSYTELIHELSNLLGKQPVLPKWTGEGAIIASQGGLAIAIEKVQAAQKAGAKVCGVWCQDWSGQLKTRFGTQVYWNWQIDESLYGGLKEQIIQWKSEGVKFLGYINTFLKQDTPLYSEALSKDYLVKTPEGSAYLVASTTFMAGIVDLTHPEAYTWYKAIVKTNMLELGFSGWMADFGEYLPTDSVVYASESAEKLHNLWPVLWAKLNREAIDECGAQDEAFFFTRAGYTDTIRHTNSMWSGDQHVDFSDEYGLPSVLCSTLSMAMSGVGINHSDVGGYTTIFHMKRSEELIMRWAELNLFSPIMRYHEGNRPEVNAQFDSSDRVIKHFAKMTQYFHALSPYLENAKQEYYTSGVPVNRPIFMHYNTEMSKVAPTTFLYGRDLLVAPVLRPNQTEVTVTLPEDEWIHLFTKKSYRGGEHVLDAPLGMPCAFFRKDSGFADLFKQISL